MDIKIYLLTQKSNIYKDKKLPVPWNFNIQKRYKKIASNFKEDLLTINRKFIAVNYPKKFIESDIRSREKDNSNGGTKEYTILSNLFEVPNSVILFERYLSVTKTKSCPSNLYKSSIHSQIRHLTSELIG